MAAALTPTRSRLLLATDAVGGVWTYSLDLARGLAGVGVETLLVCMGPAPSPAQVADAEEVPGLSLLVTGQSLDWMAREAADIHEAARALRAIARGAGVDLIHLNTPALALGGGFPAPVVGACHSCLATWWAAVKDGPMPADFAWRAHAVKCGLAACDALVAPTRAFAEMTARTYGVPAPRAIWNGRTPDRTGASVPREPCVFTAGRLWDEAKNVAVLDAAAAEVEAPVFAAGPLDNPNGGGLALANACTLGPLSAQQVRRWLARAPIYATSALYEPFGLGVLEAAQAGCALVLSDIATLRELWDGAAVFADPRDPAAFARVLNDLLEDPARCERLGSAARARAGRYTTARMTKALLGLYAGLSPAFAGAPAAEAVA